GNGTISANGGGRAYGDGAGGRVKIEYATKDTTNPIDADKVYAHTGTGGDLGGAGTIFYKPSSQTSGDLVVDNNNNAGRDTPIPTNSFAGTLPTLTLEKVAIRGKAKVGIPEDVNLVVNGDFINTNGTFTAGTNSTVILATTNQVRVTGSNTFYNLTCATARKVISFEAGRTNTVNGQLYLRRVTLISTEPEMWWGLNLDKDTGSHDVRVVAVQDSDARAGQEIVAEASWDNGHNENWLFLKPVGLRFMEGRI
ncbi:unnamed protein product, partial [marine sediment metagenome]